MWTKSYDARMLPAQSPRYQADAVLVRPTMEEFDFYNSCECIVEPHAISAKLSIIGPFCFVQYRRRLCAARNEGETERYNTVPLVVHMITSSPCKLRTSHPSMSRSILSPRLPKQCRRHKLRIDMTTFLLAKSSVILSFSLALARSLSNVVCIPRLQPITPSSRRYRTYGVARRKTNPLCAKDTS
jgi:hypothetical protein